MDIYDNSLSCGACMKVKGPDGEVKVRVVDSNGSGEKTLTLSKTAFGMISKGESGEIPEIKYKFVDCDSTDPVSIEVINGANEWYMGIRVYNANKKIESIEIFDDTQNEYRKMEPRNDFAFIAQPVNGQLISKPYKFKINAYDGSSIIETLDSFESGQKYQGINNF